MKIAVSTVLGLNMLLGNLCMMPMAYAQEMSMPSEAHDESMEMTMTPAVPMTPAHCEHCVKVKKSDANAMGSSMPCSGGHCLTQRNPVISAALPSSHAIVSVAIPASGVTLPPDSVALHSQPPPTAPPLVARMTDTVVLRF